MRRPRIGLDARFALGIRRGIGNYSLELFRSMAAMNQSFDFIFYSDREDTECLLANLPNSQVRVLRPTFYPLWEQLLLPLALQRDDIDLFHAVGNTSPIIMPRRTKLIITLCDVMYLKNKEMLPLSRSWYQRIGRLYRKLIVPHASRNADLLLTISEFSKKDIFETIMRIPPGKVEVTLLGVPATFQSLGGVQTTQPPLDGKPYLLHLGGFDPRKNTAMVVRSFLSLKRNRGLKERLVILGMQNLKNLSLSVEESIIYDDSIYFPGFVPEKDLPRYYQHATAFLFPSLYEGFGIPLLEAMACRTPIITSNVTSLPEISGDAAILVDPRDAGMFQEAIVSLLARSDLQERLSEAGRFRVQSFSWQSTAAKTLNFYKVTLGFNKNSATVKTINPIDQYEKSHG